MKALGLQVMQAAHELSLRPARRRFDRASRD
jgi:hypothetical protein